MDPVLDVCVRHGPLVISQGDVFAVAYIVWELMTGCAPYWLELDLEVQRLSIDHTLITTHTRVHEPALSRKHQGVDP